MAERKCLMTFYPTDCKDDCFNCKCGGAEATKDMYVSINNVQRVCSITGGAADTDEGEYIAEVIRNNLENMVIPAADVQPVDRWISVNDRLPKKGTEVITCSFGSDFVVQEVGETLEEAISKTKKISKVETGFYGSDGWYTIEGYPMIITPKFWQPLPEPPKIGGADDENS